MSRRCTWLAPLALWLGLAGAARALELGVVPPAGDDKVVEMIRATAAEVGVTVSVLDPAQLVDKARFTPSVYAMLIVVGGEKLPDTVIDEGDATQALQGYVDAGGALLVAATGPVMSGSLRYTQNGWQNFAAPLRRIGLQQRFGLLDAGQLIDPAPPKGALLVTGPQSPLGTRLPECFARGDDGGPFGAIPSSQDAGVAFTPLATLVDEKGGTYGAGIAATRRRDAEGKAGTVYYCWAPLLSAPNGKDILLALLALQAERGLSADDQQRQQGLFAQIAELQTRQAAAKAILPEELKGKEVEALRAELQQHADSLLWLRQATDVGNLNFVALKLVKLRDQLASLPQRIGLAVDNAVLDQVADPGGGGPTAVPVEPPKLSGDNGPAAGDPSAGAELPPPAVSPAAGRPAGVFAPAGKPRDESVKRPGPVLSEGPGSVGEAASADPLPPPAVEPGTSATGLAAPLAPQAAARATQRFPDTKLPVIEFEIAGRGKFCLELHPEAAPKTCSAFLYLVRSGFFERTYFHRRVEKFVVQGGDPYTRDLPPDHELIGTGGPDWTVPGEFANALKHERGAVGLARAPTDPDSGGSQFYICLEPQPSLDGKYCAFARVIEGLEVVDQIQVGDRIVAARVVQGAEPKNPEGAKPLELFATK